MSRKQNDAIYSILYLNHENSLVVRYIIVVQIGGWTFFAMNW